MYLYRESCACNTLCCLILSYFILSSIFVVKSIRYVKIELRTQKFSQHNSCRLNASNNANILL